MLDTEVFSKTGNDGFNQQFNIIQQDNSFTAGTYELYYTISILSYPQINKAYFDQFVESAFTVEIEGQPLDCTVGYPIKAISLSCPPVSDDNTDGGQPI